MNEKLITAAWFDIDDTLLSHTLRPTEAMLKALAGVPNKGINTSRGITRAEKAIYPTEVNLPAVTLTGAEIWNVGGEMIHSFPFDRAEKEMLTETVLVDDHLAMAGFHLSGTRSVAVFAPTENDLVAAEKKFASRGQVHLATTSRSEFISLFFQTSVSWLSVKAFPETLLEVTPIMDSTFSIDADGSYLKLRKKGVTKGSSLAWLCDYLGIDPQTVMTFGDGAQTDVEAFKITQGVSIGETPLPYAINYLENIDELALFLLKHFPPPHVFPR